jgi:branched-chain amino acid transport system ATP-binding protein
MSRDDHAGDAALHAVDVDVRLGGLRILDKVHIRLEPGERRAILGPNGAGKTTLFNVLTGALRPSGGAVRLSGRDVTRWPAHKRASAGLARTFQITNLMHTMTVHENVVLALAAHQPAVRRNLVRPLAREHAVRERAEALLAEWELESRARLPVHLLSYGERRELEIVLAVAADPSVLLLDEPTAGLSPAETQKVASLVGRLPRSVGVIVIEHDLDVALALAETVTVMADGRVWAQGPASSDEINDAVRNIYMARTEVSHADR